MILGGYPVFSDKSLRISLNFKIFSNWAFAKSSISSAGSFLIGQLLQTSELSSWLLQE
jgi:hypothetical protein